MNDKPLLKVHNDVRAKLPESEQKDFDVWMARLATEKPTMRPRTTDMIPLGDVMAGVRERAEQLASMGDTDAQARLERLQRFRERRERGEFAIQKPVTCQTCKDAGEVLPPPDPATRERRAIPCPACGYPVRRQKMELVFPVPDGTVALAAQPILETAAGVTRLNNLIDALLTHQPSGVMVLIDGMYGTAKTHALAKLYEGMWERKRTAIYVPSALELERIFTDFENEAERTKAADDTIGHASASDRRARRWNLLVNCDFLLIDEMNRYSRQNGNGWVERHIFTLIDERLANRKTTIGAGNGLLSAEPKTGLHPGVIDRARSQDSFVLSLDNVASSRKYFGRNGTTWHEGVKA